MSLASERSLTYGEYIAQCLHRVAHKIRSEDAGVAFLRLTAFFLIYLVVAIALDHAFNLSALLRTLLFASCLVAWAVYAYLGLIRPLIKRVNEWYVARVVDRVVPELEDGVTTVLDLEHRADDPAVKLAKPVVEDRVVQVLLKVPVEERLSSDRLLHAWYLLAAAVLLCCLGVLINSLWFQRSVLSSLARVLIPWADVPYPTRTRIVDVDPGDDPERSRAVAGSDVTIRAMVEGYIPENVYLFWSDDGGKRWRQVALNRPETAIDPWWVKLPQVEQSFTYYLQGGDCTTKIYQFTVVPVPVVQELQVRYEYPEYTGREPYVSDLPDIDALEGTRITITARMEGPVREARLVFGPDKRTSLPMHRLPDDPTRVQGSFQVTRDDVYRIWFVLESGDSNPNPPVHQIKCRQDQPPAVTIKQPGRDILDPPLPVNRVLPIAVLASDDLGLRTVDLVIALPGGIQRRESLLDLPTGIRTDGQFEYRFDPEALGLQPGDRIRYWAEATDRKGQSTKSQEYAVVIGSPERPEELAQEPNESQQDTQEQEGRSEATDAEEPSEEQKQEQGADGEAEQPADEQGAGQEGPGDEREADEEAEGGQARAEQQAAQEGGPVEDPEEALRRIEEYFREQEEQQAEQGGSDRGDGAAGEQQVDENGESGEQGSEAGMSQDKPSEQPNGAEGAESGESGAEDGEGADGRQDGEAGGQQEGGQGAEQGMPTDEMAVKGPSDNMGPAQPGEAQTPSDGPVDGAAEAEGEQGGAQGKPEVGEGTGGQTDEPAQRGDQAMRQEGDGQGAGPEQGERAGQGAEDGEAGESAAGEPGEAGAGQAGEQRPEAPASNRPGGGEPSGGQQAGGQGESRQSGAAQGAGEEGAVDLPQGLGASGMRKEGQDGERGGEAAGGQPASHDAGQEGAAAQGQGTTDTQDGGAQGAASQRPGGEGAAGGQTGTPSADQQGAGGTRPGVAGEAEGGRRSAVGEGAAAGEGEGTPNGQASEAASGQGAGAKGAGEAGEGQGGKPGGQGGTPGGERGAGPGKSGGAAQPGMGQGSGARTGTGNQATGGGVAPGGDGSAPQTADVEGQQGGLGGGPRHGPRPGGQDRSEPGQEDTNVSLAARQATELVLTKLEEMLRNDRVDPELLRRLGWTEEDLRRFLKYLKAQQQRQRPGQVAPIGAGGRRMLSGPQGVVSEDTDAIDIGRTPPPPEYREIIEAYSRSLSEGTSED